MPQSDFASLAIQSTLADESIRATEVYGLSVSKPSIVSNHSKDDKLNVPVFDKNCMVMAECESSSLTSSSDHMDLDFVSERNFEDMFEPARPLKEFVPPKRFYRTFWRSLSMRMLQCKHAYDLSALHRSKGKRQGQNQSL